MSDELDNCQLCYGANGGVRGNENVVEGIVMCDYCHAKLAPILARTPPPSTDATVEIARLIRVWDETEELTVDSAYEFIEALVGACRASLRDQKVSDDE